MSSVSPRDIAYVLYRYLFDIHPVLRKNYAVTHYVNQEEMLARLEYLAAKCRVRVEDVEDIIDEQKR